MPLWCEIESKVLAERESIYINILNEIFFFRFLKAFESKKDLQYTYSVPTVIED